MILRTLAPIVGLLALGGSINAVNAAEAVAVPVAETAPGDPTLPRFAPSDDAFEQAFETFEAPVEIAVPAHAVDMDTIEPAVEEQAASIGSGVASWYGDEFEGRKTANGERFDPDALTAAHRSLPFGSRVRVTRDGRSVVVRINDRGPFHGNRVIDLSEAAAEQIGLRRAGSGRVELALVS